MTRHDESHLQQVCVKWFRAFFPEYDILLFAVPNGGLKSKIEAGIQKGEGVVRGVSDLILLVPSAGFHGLCIEMKKDSVVYEDGKVKHRKTYQRPDQKAWQERVEAQGYKYMVIRTFDDFRHAVEEYLGRSQERVNLDTLERMLA